MMNSPDVDAPDVMVNAKRGVPTLGDVAPEATKQMASINESRGNLDAASAAQTAAEQEHLRAREADLAGPRAGLMEAASAKIPDMPGMEQTPDAPNEPIIDHEKFKSFGMIAFPFILLLGRAMRADGTQALNALSSAVQGYQHGRQEESKRQFEVFKAKFQKVLTDNKQKLEEYKNILARRDLDMQQKQTLLQVAAMKHDDVSMQDAVQRKSIKDQYAELDKQMTAAQKMADAEVKLSVAMENNYTKREAIRARAEQAAQKIKAMGTTRSDGNAQKKQQWLHTQQINIYKTFATKMAALTAKQQFLTPSAFKMAEQQLRIEYANAIRMTNDMGRAEGFQISPDMEAMEHPENDPFGPSTAPSSEAENKSFLDSIQNGWRYLFGSPPGANPAVTNKPAAPSGNDGWSATPK